MERVPNEGDPEDGSEAEMRKAALLQTKRLETTVFSVLYTMVKNNDVPFLVEASLMAIEDLQLMAFAWTTEFGITGLPDWMWIVFHPLKFIIHGGYIYFQWFAFGAFLLIAIAGCSGAYVGVSYQRGQFKHLWPLKLLRLLTALLTTVLLNPILEAFAIGINCNISGPTCIHLSTRSVNSVSSTNCLEGVPTLRDFPDVPCFQENTFFYLSTMLGLMVFVPFTWMMALILMNPSPKKGENFTAKAHGRCDIKYLALRFIMICVLEFTSSSGFKLTVLIVGFAYLIFIYTVYMPFYSIITTRLRVALLCAAFCNSLVALASYSELFGSLENTYVAMGCALGLGSFLGSYLPVISYKQATSQVYRSIAESMENQRLGLTSNYMVRAKKGGSANGFSFLFHPENVFDIASTKIAPPPRVFKYWRHVEIASRFARHNKEDDAKRLMHYIFEQGIEQFPDQPLIYLLYSNYIRAFDMNEVKKAEKLIKKVSKSGLLAFDVRALVFFEQRSMEQALETAGLSAEGDLSVTRYVEYQQLEARALEFHKSTLNELRLFWGYLSNSHCQASALRIIAERMHSSEKPAEHYYCEMLKQYPKSKTILRMYATWLSQVKLDEDGASQYMEAADQQEDLETVELLRHQWAMSAKSGHSDDRLSAHHAASSEKIPQSVIRSPALLTTDGLAPSAGGGGPIYDNIGFGNSRSHINSNGNINSRIFDESLGNLIRTNRSRRLSEDLVIPPGRRMSLDVNNPSKMNMSKMSFEEYIPNLPDDPARRSSVHVIKSTTSALVRRIAKESRSVVGNMGLFALAEQNESPKETQSGHTGGKSGRTSRNMSRKNSIFGAESNATLSANDTRSRRMNRSIIEARMRSSVHGLTRYFVALAIVYVLSVIVMFEHMLAQFEANPKILEQLVEASFTSARMVGLSRTVRKVMVAAQRNDMDAYYTAHDELRAYIEVWKDTALDVLQSAASRPYAIRYKVTRNPNTALTYVWTSEYGIGTEVFRRGEKIASRDLDYFADPYISEDDEFRFFAVHNILPLSTPIVNLVESAENAALDSIISTLFSGFGLLLFSVVMLIILRFGIFRFMLKSSDTFQLQVMRLFMFLDKNLCRTLYANISEEMEAFFGNQRGQGKSIKDALNPRTLDSNQEFFLTASEKKYSREFSLWLAGALFLSLAILIPPTYIMSDFVVKVKTIMHSNSRTYLTEAVLALSGEIAINDNETLHDYYDIREIEADLLDYIDQLERRHDLVCTGLGDWGEVLDVPPILAVSEIGAITYGTGRCLAKIGCDEAVRNGTQIGASGQELIHSGLFILVKTFINEAQQYARYPGDVRTGNLTSYRILEYIAPDINGGVLEISDALQTEAQVKEILGSQITVVAFTAWCVVVVLGTLSFRKHMAKREGEMDQMIELLFRIPQSITENTPEMQRFIDSGGTMEMVIRPTKEGRL